MNQGQEVAAGVQEPQEAPAAVPPADDEEPQVVKRLKYSEPDLQITCKGKDGSEKTFHRYGAVMAWNSKYFDTLLASEMQESITKKVTLEDVSPETFELAMELIDDMGRASKATVTDFVEVASFYNRFDFENGLKRCISALVEFMKLRTAKLHNLTYVLSKRLPKKEEMENILATICIAADTEEAELVQICIEFLRDKLMSHSVLFDVDRIRRIQGFFVNNEECLDRFFRRFYSANYERPDISDPDFPSRLAGKLQSLTFVQRMTGQSFCIRLAARRKAYPNAFVEGKNFTLDNSLGIDNGIDFQTRDVTVYEGSRFRNVRLSQIDETYDDEMECERFDWCVSFEFRGITNHLALPQSRNIPNPLGRIERWIHVKGPLSRRYDFSVTSLAIQNTRR